MQKEFESVQMRPLAKAVTKTLEKVRGLIREQVGDHIKNNHLNAGGSRRKYFSSGGFILPKF